MPLDSIAKICDLIWYWISQSDPAVLDDIPAAYRQKGGWEGWAQIEIAYLVNKKYKNVTMDREVNVYARTQKENDFVIKHKTDATRPKQVIELKCK